MKESRKIFKDKGILEDPIKKTGKGVPENVKDLVEEFYNNEEYSRIMPGKKDCVSISRNVHKQKRLLLCNLKEPHQEFKKKLSNSENRTFNLLFFKT